MKIVYADSERCLGCRNCERVCALQKGGGFKARDANIWVSVDMVERAIITLTCRQCEKAACMASCPSDALQRHPGTRAVVVNEDLCVGCRSCVAACPFGCVHFNETRQVAAKCDLCSGDPKCVKSCMALALHYGDINDLAARRRWVAVRGELARAAPLSGRNKGRGR